MTYIQLLNIRFLFSDYDMDDPFIDDSDMVQEIEIDLRMKKARTKQSGFFVSSGKLELVLVLTHSVILLGPRVR